MLTGGSLALKHWLGDQFWREPKDTDYLCKREELPIEYKDNKDVIISDLKKGIDYIIVDDCTELLYIYNHNLDKVYLDLEWCSVFKTSHKHMYLGKFRKSFKHLIDYSRLKKIHTLSRFESDIANGVKNYFIESVYNNDPRLLYFPKLDKSKEDFFNDHVTYYVDHDLIHEKVAIGSEPAYRYCLTGEVMFSNKLFNALDYIKKVNMVLEEAFVLAIERCLLPFFHGSLDIPAVTPRDAFQYALTRVATNITSGDFRDFAANNFSDIYDIYLKNHTNYYKIIKEFKNE